MESKSYNKSMINFEEFDFENTGMVFHPEKITGSGTRIWIVTFKDKKYKLSMYYNKNGSFYEFRYCGIDDNVIGKNSERIGTINKNSFINDSNVAYEALSLIFEILA